MSDHSPQAPGHDQDGPSGEAATEETAAAGEAAQNVVDEVTSWEYSAEPGTIREQLDAGLDQAGVDVPDTERDRLVEEIDGVKQDETRGAPQVQPAEVAGTAEGDRA